MEGILTASLGVVNNISATQRLLEAVRSVETPRLVFASSSSVYGQSAQLLRESTPCRPFSPYGVTKLAAEQLCGAYAQNFGIATVSLRLFTVYGPRQRPDMAFDRLITAALTGAQFPVYGAGDQVRDFTYVGDVVDAAVRAATADVEPGSVFNVAGGSAARLRDVIRLVEELTDSPVRIREMDRQAGDVSKTEADTTRAHSELVWSPRVDLADGLRLQVEAVGERVTSDASTR